MSARGNRDPLLTVLASLPPVAPDDARAERVRERCRQRLERPPRELPAAVEPATIGSLCALYAWQILRMVVR